MTRRKGRAFDGCWTCRQRKVKCDLTKPQCTRCIKSNRVCQGYEIRLGWSLPMSYSKNDNSLIYLKIKGYEENLDNFQRRNVDFVKYPKNMIYETYYELNQVLGKFDDCKLDFTAGPFSCMKMLNNTTEDNDDDEVEVEVENITEVEVNLTSTRRKNNKRISNGSGSAIGSTSPNKRTRHAKDPGEDGELSVSINQPGNVIIERSESIDDYTVDKHLSELLDFAKLTIIGIKGPNYEINHQTIYHIFNPEFFPNVDSDDDWVIEAKYNLSKLWIIQNGSIQLTPLFQKLLTNFKSEYISFNRMGYQNSYIDLFIMPFIKQIFGEFICWDHTTWDFEFENLDLDDQSSTDGIIKNIKLVIVYLTLSISSFHLSKPITSNSDFKLDEYLTLALYFRKLGIFLLNHHLDEADTIIELLKDDDSNLELYNCCLLLSLVLQIEINNSIQVFEDFELIYAIGDFVINSIRNSKHKSSNLLKLLINMVKILATFYKSTQAINMFNYQMVRKYDDDDEEEDEGGMRGRTQDSDSELLDSEDEDDEDDDDNGYMKPAIKNLIISTEPTSESMSYTVSFNSNASTKSRQNSRTVPRPPESPIKDKSLFIPNDKFTYNLDINHIYQMYGIPRSLLNLFDEIIHLTNHKNIYTMRQSFPRNFPKICTDFEDRLVNWTIEQDSQWQLSSNNSNHELLRLNITSFHLALIAYYNQLLKKFTKLKDYQHVINSSLENYLKLLQFKSNNNKIKPLIWNLLILGSCTIDPNVMTKINQLCTDMNQWRCKQILFEIWNKREKDSPDIDESLGFMSMIREYGIVLNLG